MRKIGYYVVVALLGFFIGVVSATALTEIDLNKSIVTFPTALDQMGNVLK